MQLVDLWRGQLTLRRLHVLIEHLPPESATARAQIDGPLASWSLTDALLGRLVDELSAYRWQWESAHIDPKKTRMRSQPESVLPRAESSSDADVIPIVSPHKLGGYINEDEEQEGA